ncbi:MAG TPA: amino acid adenylation domain-containing protein [Solirubrobacteraceae bacterium]|jgi:amino acid adenylation domain-containing protein|nr:amino acid adenylation domain-containing protein [Solirubrobacteraceae bacterium]
MQQTKTETVGFRLSPQQHQRLLASSEGPGVVQCAVLLDGPVDLGKLRAALDRLGARHEILRTTFVQPSGVRTPQQVIAEEPVSMWPAEVEPDAVTIDASAALEALMVSEAERAFDLEHGPLIRARLAGGGENAALLLLTACVACADATSLAALAGELCEAHRDGEQGDEPLQYADYAEWRHELITGEEGEAQDGAAFWREDAADRPGPPRILFALPAAADGRNRAATVPLALDWIELDDLQRTAVGAGVSIAVFLEAAWHALLARMSGASEILIASRCDGRAQPDLAGAVGPYEQPAPVRSRFHETITFAEILDQVRRSRALAVRWQDFATAEDLSRLAEQAAAGWAFHSVAPAARVLALRVAPTSRVTLALRSGESELAGELVYDSVAVSHDDAMELAARYSTLLRSALADPSVPVAQLAILEAGERERLLAAAGAEAATTEPPVHERFAEQARRTPERPAVSDASRSLSFGELDAAANRLANHLSQLGDVRRQPVGLCMERTPSMVVALLAILKAGGAYLPLNHEHPPARISHQLRDAGAKVLLTEQHLLDSLPALDTAVVCVDRDAEAIAGQPAAGPDLTVGSEDLAYVMYTSGSTGTPKGVAVTHANLASYATAIAVRLSAGEEAHGLVFGVVSAISTDLGNTSIFTPLITGGSIRLISAEASTDGEYLAGELAGEQLDVLKIAPSHLRALLGPEGVLPKRWLLIGGEALSWELVEQIRSQSPSCQILNHYGPTETTVGCATYLLGEQPRPDSLTVPIGFSLAGARLYVLDRLLEPVPAGVPGELCVAGAGVAAGYLGAAEQGGGFAADPFAPGAMYRTGDRVRRLRDGAIEFLGRLDDQVKIRGFRIEPGEIETTLLGHSALRQVAVCAEDDERGGQRLVAYLVSSDTPAVEELRAFLGETLPDHMIPSIFRTVEALPLSASGKIDRRALAGIAEVQARREAEYIAPRDAVEQQIADIWGELLGVERVGALDDFFALGGHSLLATQATMRIRRLYGDIPLRALLAAPTVAALADVVRATGTLSAT